LEASKNQAGFALSLRVILAEKSSFLDAALAVGEKTTGRVLSGHER
jgi:hypothetical protein